MEQVKGQALEIQDELKGIEELSAKQIRATFDPMTAMLDKFEDAYEEIMKLDKEDPETAKRAKRLRLDIAKIRNDAEKERVKLKAESLRTGKAIDGVNAILKKAIVGKENNLKEIETFQERKEAEAKEVLKNSRIEALAEFGIDGNSLNLGEMQDDVWTIYLNGKKAEQEAQKEAERKAKEEREALALKESNYMKRRVELLPFSEFPAFERLTPETTEEEFKTLSLDLCTARNEKEAEAERVRQENEKLRVEREEAQVKAKKELKDRQAKEKADQDERDRIEKKRLDNEEKARLAREKKAEEERLSREKEQAKKDEEIRIEREKREKAEREAWEAEEARTREAQEREEARLAEIKKAESAPDKEKLIKAVEYLFSIDIKSIEAGSAMKDATNILKKCIEEM
jgi:hypothetical protein